MSITVRATTADDLGVVAALRRAWTEENAGGPVDDDGFDERFAAWIGGAGGERRAWLAFALATWRSRGVSADCSRPRSPTRARRGRPAGPESE